MKYTEISNSKIIYSGCDLTEFAKRYGTPLKITFLDMIRDNVVNLKKVFDDTITAQGYKGKFLYLNANKANYSFETIDLVAKYGDGLETSSYNDLLVTAKIMKRNKNYIKKPIVCNGVKDKDYLDEILKLNSEGMDITCVIDNLSEFEYLQARLTDKKLKVGLRVHLTCLYTDISDPAKDDRFGLIKKDFDYLVKQLKSNSKMVLTTVHFHQRGMNFDEPKFWENFMIVFADYYVRVKKEIPTLCDLDIGGGMPVLMREFFDYKPWIKMMLEKVSAVCKQEKIDQPNIVSENGKYTVKDATVLIYEVIAQKITDGKIPWYIIDGSFFSAIAEHYEADEPFLIQPVNLLNNPEIDVRLAGLTCDSDDVYFEEKGTIKMPIIKENEKLYIAVLGCGSYQDSMQGRGGVHHCLMPEEMRLIRGLDGKYKILAKRQSIKDIWGLIKK